MSVIVLHTYRYGHLHGSQFAKCCENAECSNPYEEETIDQSSWTSTGFAPISISLLALL